MTKQVKQFFSDNCSDALTITSSKRLARRLRSDYDQQQRLDASKEVWHSLKILPLDSWLKDCWQTALISGQLSPQLLLNGCQEQFLWQQIITTSNHSTHLLDITATAQQVQKTWKLLWQWQVSVDDPRLQSSEAGKVFSQWAQEFSHRQQSFITSSTLVQKVTQLVTAGLLTLPKKINFVGFIELTPDVEKLISTLAQAGVTVSCQSSITPPNRACTFYTAALNTDDEIKLMLNWAKSKLETTPNAVIGCIVPQLFQNRDRIDYYCQRLLSQQPYSISSGSSLAQEPIIDNALLLLSINSTLLGIEQIGAILRSPFMSAYLQEGSQRHLLDATLRKNNHHQLELSALRQRSQSCPILQQHLATLSYHHGNKSASEWLTIFSDKLKKMGWPGQRTLNSREYQALEQWQEVFDQFASLDLVCPNGMSYEKAQQQLKQLSCDKLFQPQSDYGSIHILGSLESSGLPFSHLWLMGADDNSWPQAADANPFIPYALQRQLNMPHASGARELHFSQKMMAHWIANSQYLICSYAQQQADQIKYPSSLIKDFEPIDLSQHRVVKSEFQKTALQSLEDHQAPLDSGSITVSGGSTLLEDQAVCPFKAFAHYRLQAYPVETTTLGITPRDRGNLVHKILEQFWQQVQSHKQLQAFSATALKQLVTKITTRTIENYTKQQQFPQTFLEIENKCLLELILQWLLLEKSRSDFVVTTTEKKQQVPLNNLMLTICIDRIDRLADGSQIIIDYKTAKTISTNSWFGDRPEKPQLLLYAYSQTPRPNGIYFAQISAYGCKAEGISDDKSHIIDKGKTLDKCSQYTKETEWSQQLDAWQNTLNQLALAFQAGDARVDPKTDQSCNHCHYQSLCRIYHR